MTSGVFSKVCFKRREGSVTLHPIMHREGSVTLHPFVLKHREAKKGSLPPEALLRKGEQI